MRGMIKFTIYGSPPRKSNRRQWTGRMLIKSREAREYVADLRRQIPPGARQRLSGPIQFTARIYYSNRQSDLSAELIMDALQDQYELVPDPKGGYTPTGRPKKKRVLVRGGVYRDDRQIETLTLYKSFDKGSPRAKITIEELPCLAMGERSG